MARLLYGLSAGDYVSDQTGAIKPGSTVTVWTHRAGGSQVTDLLGVSGVTTVDGAGVVTSTTGAVGVMGPDGYTGELWAQAGAGDRVRLDTSPSGAVGPVVESVRHRAIYAGDYGALGTADDSATLNAALADASGRRLVLPPDATLFTTGLSLASLSDADIDGNGSTLSLVSTGSRYAALSLTGTGANVRVHGFNIQGNGVVADQHQGIGILTGSDYQHVTIEGNKVQNTILGITVSADGTGTVRDVLVANNVLTDILGTASGYGYGIHVACSGTESHRITIAHNTIERARRHSIYQAKGRGVLILGNRVIDHRIDQLVSNYLAAIMVARSGDVQVIGNQVIRPACGGISVGGQGTGDLAGPVLVQGNILVNPQDGTALLVIGQQAPATEGTAVDTEVKDNILTATAAAGPLLMVLNGLRVRLAGNRFKLPASTATALNLAGTGVTGNDYMDNVVVERNVFDTATTSNVAVRIPSGLTSKMLFDGNIRVDGGSPFTVSAAVANPNITVRNQSTAGLVFATGVSAAAYPFAGPTSTTAPAAGGAGALPATPAGYMSVVINGTTRQIPYY